MITAYDMRASNRRKVFFLFTAFVVLLMLAVYVVAYGYALHTYAYEDIDGEQSYLSRFGGAVAEYVVDAVANADAQEIHFVFPDTKTLQKKAHQFALGAVAFVLLLAVLWLKGGERLAVSMALNASHAVRLQEEQHRELYRLAGTACIGAGIKPVKLYVISDRGLNAFSVGISDDTAGIVLTQGLLNKLSKSELEAVLAHEVAHLRNGDVRLMMAGLSSALLFSFLSETMFLLSFNPKKGGFVSMIVGFVLGVLCGVIGWFALPLMRLALSRSCELNADAEAVLICRQPQALISALEKIGQDSYVSVLNNHPTMAAMCIANPRGKSSLVLYLSGFFSTHPDMSERIEALRRMDGGF